MLEESPISRRQALAAVGAGTTGVGGYLIGVRSADSVPDWLAGRECAPAPLVTSQTDWAFPRHDRANTGHAPDLSGPSWPLEQAWERDWPIGNLDEINSLVAVDGLVVSLLRAQPRDVLLARSIADGQVRWRQWIEDAYRGRACAASGFAFVQAKRSESSGMFTAHSLGDGTPLWTAPSSSHVPRTLAGGRLLTVERSPDRSRDNTHFAITALDARTGVECWRRVYGGRPLDIAVVDDQIIIPTRDQGVRSLDPATGEKRWRSEVGGDTAAILDDFVISSRFHGELKALSLSDGSLEWELQSEYFPDGSEGDDWREYARPGFEVGAVTSDTIVYTLDVYSDYPDRVQARDLETGDLLWDVGPEPTPVEWHSYSRPVVVGDDVLVIRYARREGREEIPNALRRIDVATGSERDRVTFPVNETVYSPIVADDTLLVPTEERLVAYR